jgi:hypothetical protein
MMNYLQFTAFALKEASMPTLDTARAPKSLPTIVSALCLFFASLVALGFAGYPIYVIRPFREQTPAALDRALWVGLHNRLPLIILAVLITALTFLLWRRTDWVERLLLAPAAVIAVIAAAFSWVNPYEHMFHPLGAPHYVTAQQAAVDANDMVIAVTLRGESRAYPIREMGYHHVVNDRLHQLPIVVTY